MDGAKVRCDSGTMTSQSHTSGNHSTNIEEVDILIVGGGPAGLSTALSIQYHTHLTEIGTVRKPKVLLVDALPKGQNESRALVVHARTLEVLDSIGCAKPLVSLGVVSDTLILQSAPKANSKGYVLFQTDFALLKGLTEYPFGLVVAQHVTERAFAKLLRDRAGNEQGNEIPFLRGLKMIGMEEMERDTGDGKKKGFLVKFDDGRLVWCQYLIGADGSRSAVRTHSGIPFEDPATKSSGLAKFVNNLLTSHSQEYIGLADVEFLEDIRRKHAGVGKRNTLTFNSRGFLLFAPVKLTRGAIEGSVSEDEGENSEERFLYRLAFLIPDKEAETARLALSPGKTTNTSEETNGHTPVYRDGYKAMAETISYLQDRVDAGVRYIPTKSGPDDLPICPAEGTIPHVKNVIWTSTFRIRYAVADTLHKVFSGASDDISSADSGHVLLVGDAAHVHSPAGGQGMNLGIRDGLECGKAIAEHWCASHGGSTVPASTLDEPFNQYSLCRRKEALRIIAITKRMSWVGTLKAGSFSARVRDWLVWLLGRTGFAKKKFVLTMSGLGRRR